MARIEQIKKEFTGLYGSINLYLGDGISINFIDVNEDRIEGDSTVTASCGCCLELVDFEKSLSDEVECLDDEDFSDLIECMRELKSKLQVFNNV